jgi:hypothetical protein
VEIKHGTGCKRKRTTNLIKIARHLWNLEKYTRLITKHITYGATEDWNVVWKK